MRVLGPVRRPQPGEPTFPIRRLGQELRPCEDRVVDGNQDPSYRGLHRAEVLPALQSPDHTASRVLGCHRLRGHLRELARHRGLDRGNPDDDLAAFRAGPGETLRVVQQVVWKFTIGNLRSGSRQKQSGAGYVVCGVPRLGGRRREDGPLPVEVALVRVDPADELPDLGRLTEAQCIFPEGVEGAVHGVEHAEGVVRLEGVDRVFELAGPRATAGADPPPDIYGSWRTFFLSMPRGFFLPPPRGLGGSTFLWLGAAG